MAVINTKYKVNPVTPVPAAPKTAEDLAKQYGNINYKDDEIAKIFQDQVTAEYDAKQKGYDRTANSFYNRLGATQNTMMDTLAKERNNAIMTGASSGIQSSNAIKGLLGLQQQSVEDNTTLTQEGRALSDERAAALAQAQRDAMITADQNKLALATHDVNARTVDAQQYAAELGHNAQLSAADLAAQAQGYTAEQQRVGTQYAADKGLAGQQAYATGLVGSASINKQASDYAADANFDANVYSANLDYNKQLQTNITALAQQYFSSDKVADGDSAMQFIKDLTTLQIAREHYYK